MVNQCVSGGSAGVVTYEVHYRGDHAKFAEAAKVCSSECIIFLNSTTERSKRNQLLIKSF